MDLEFVAGALWAMLGLSIGLTVVGLSLPSWRAMGMAAVLSLVFGIAGILSIGIFVLAGTLVQVILTLVLRRAARERGEG